ncbi:hypothetical protein [Neorhizobium galegae]|uniref:hypothetical protein n=1 Tax=Neorhizobium galegae TaxID=399 RepID=UPI00203563F9|nr:hypothetical protein [Neorhizobium galegae]MCM2501593.1 hypothetical protein [Neorhizobium galegae]MCQ1780592.1 hypothetical protein [Neorhizobium galegae]MCQ1798470.1 hypothetical protein [Neorhizobium galegae]
MEEVKSLEQQIAKVVALKEVAKGASNIEDLREILSELCCTLEALMIAGDPLWQNKK